MAPAFASDTDTKSVDNADTCTHGTGWASQGAFTLTTADDQVYWSSIHHLTVNRANGVTQLLHCIDGYKQSGGSKKLSESWTVTGDDVTACTVGFNLGCDFTATKATDSYSTGWINNANGSLTVNTSGGEVSTSSLGQLKTYSHKVTGFFKASSGDTSSTTATVNFAYGD